MARVLLAAAARGADPAGSPAGLPARSPAALFGQVALHVADGGDRAAEAGGAQQQEVAQQPAQPTPRAGLSGRVLPPVGLAPLVR